MPVNKEINANKSILKATSVFGSVKLFKIFSSIITTKCAAILLGPSGVGILGLLKSTINLISSVSSFGFTITGIKEIAQHTPIEKNNTDELRKSISTLKQFALIISIIGCISTLLFSKKISLIVFKTEAEYLWIVLLSVNFFFINYNTCIRAILQGLRKIKLIALSGIVSAFMVAISTIPFYYLLGIKGIIPAILVSNFMGVIVNTYYLKKLNLSPKKISFKQFSVKAKDLLKLGFLLSLNIIFGFITNFLIKLYLETYGNTEATLGYYEASIVIFTSYFGIVFSSMAIDYYPKLTSIRDRNNEIKTLVNQQIEIALLLVTPLIVLMYSFSKIALKILYSSEFDKVEIIFTFGLLAIVFKAVIWPLGFIILAKDDKRHYFYQELLGDFLNILFCILFYQKIGLIGLGLAMFVNYLLSIIYIYYFIQKKYDFSFEIETVAIFVVSFALAASAALATYYLYGIYLKIILGILIIASISYSFFLINKKTDLINTLKQKINF